MARFKHLQIYIKSEKLLVDIEKMVMTMQKNSKYSLGDDLRNTFRRFVVIIAKVNSIENHKERLPYMSKMMELINETFIILSVFRELKLFTKKGQYEALLEDLSNIEKQLEGWKKSCN